MTKRSRNQFLSAVVGIGLLAAVAQAQSEPRVSADDRQTPVIQPIIGTAYESVCHIWIKRAWRILGIRLPFGRPKYSGTGILYQGRYVLTAGHNLYQDNSDILGLDIRCGETNPDSRNSGQIDDKIDSWQTLDAQGYDGSPFGRDFGVIRLSRYISVAEPFSLTRAPVTAGENVFFAGYPAKRNATPGYPFKEKDDGWRLYAAEALTLAQSPQPNVVSLDGLIYYDLVTYRSNSGGPVWRNRADGAPELVAIHVTDFAGRIVDDAFVEEVHRLMRLLDERADLRRQDDLSPD